MFQEQPWPQGQAPSLACVVPYQNDCPEAIFRLDLFHCWKCGLGRDLTGSTLVLLLQLEFFDSESDSEFNFPALLERAFGLF